MILLQQIVTGDQTYSVANNRNLIVFDIHNDSPYNAGVSFGANVGIGNAPYYLSPHGILQGISPVEAGLRSVGGSRWNGTIYVYTQTPLGGSGTTVLSTVPASQITIIGYPVGYAPSATVAMSRWNNIGNSINTVGGTASAVQNDAMPSGTSVIEATPSGFGSSSVSLLNQGILLLGQNLGGEEGEIRLLSASGSTKDSTIIGGNATFPIGINANLLTALANNDIGLHVATSQRVVSTVNGVNTFTVDGNGANLLAGTLAFLVGSLSRIKLFTGTSLAGKVTVSHNLGAVPDFVFLIFSAITSTPVATTLAYNSATLTSTTVDVWSSFTGANFTGIAIKF